MIRKTILAIATAAVVGGAALAPTSAFAWKGKHHGHHYGGWGFGTVVVVADDDCGWQWFRNRRGYLVKRYVCD